MESFIRIPKKRKDILRKSPIKLKKLEEMTKTRINIDDDIVIEGESLDVFQAKEILKAFGRGFDIDTSLSLLDDEYSLEVIDLTEFAKTKNRLMTIKGRLIGTNGKTKDYIEKYTDVKLSVSGKTISIIGRWDKISVAKEAILMILRGSMHQTLYRWLEQKIARPKTW